ncbi:MAG: hypothetical protein QXI19_09030 [Candidatus Caldarchaeum sp.]
MLSLISGAFTLSLLFSQEGSLITRDDFQAIGTLTVAFGSVRSPDGTIRNISGMRLPVRTRLVSLGEAHTLSDGGGTDMPTLAYQNRDLNALFATGAEFPMPSALDDITLAEIGRGAQWKWMTFAFTTWLQNMNEPWLIRWRVFDTFVPGRGAGNSAFINEFADFGVIATLSALGLSRPPQRNEAVVVTIDVQQANVVARDGSFYIAQQFREFQYPVNPEAPFRMDFWTVFSGSGVTLGSSEDIFYYDSDFNGIYDETEVETFDDPPNDLANFCFEIYVNPMETLLPSSYTLERGQVISGELADIWYSDDLYLKMRPWIVLSGAEAPVRIVIEGRLQNPSTVTSLAFLLESGVNMSNLGLTIEMFNFRTNSWVVVHEGPASTSDTTQQISAPGPVADFRDSTGRVRSRVSWRALGIVIGYPWQARIDQAVWRFSRS